MAGSRVNGHGIGCLALGLFDPMPHQGLFTHYQGSTGNKAAVGILLAAGNGGRRGVGQTQGQHLNRLPQARLHINHNIKIQKWIATRMHSHKQGTAGVVSCQVIHGDAGDSPLRSKTRPKASLDLLGKLPPGVESTSIACHPQQSLTARKWNSSHPPSSRCLA